MQTLVARVQEVEGQWAKDRPKSKSSTPPSSDGLARAGRKPKRVRPTSGKKPGGQPGHRGRHLRLVATSDRVIATSR